MKTFQVPSAYRSPLITAVKNKRRTDDKMKKDFTPTLLDFGPLHIYLARHFGFCYGVENAIDIAFRTVEENPDKNIFLLSEMIHNPQVNQDLKNKGIRFLQDTKGNQIIPFDTLRSTDVVITPAFGTSLEIDALLKSKGIHTENYNTTCPFVEKVWNRSGQIAEKKFTVIIHGKPGHEETRATFSHAAAGGPALVIKDMEEAVLLSHFIKKENRKAESSVKRRGADLPLNEQYPDEDKNTSDLPLKGRHPDEDIKTADLPLKEQYSDEDKKTSDFFELFKNRYSEGFDPGTDLERIGVVNQTTMLAAETQQIADYLKQAIHEKWNIRNEHDSDRADHSLEKSAEQSDRANHSTEQSTEQSDRPSDHFADTRDTLCYATNDNQSAVLGMLYTPADFAIVVGGYNSSNTSHLVELCEQQLPTYFVEGPDKMISEKEILHYDLHSHQEKLTSDWLPNRHPLKVLITSGASCPDAIVESVIDKLRQFVKGTKNLEELMERFQD